MFLFMCGLRAHVRDSRSCKQAVFTQSNTCAKPPVYSNRAVLTGFCGDISSIQEGQSRLSMTTEADKSKPEKDNVLAWITKASTHSGEPYFSFARIEKCCSPSHYLSQFVPQAPECTRGLAYVRVWRRCHGSYIAWCVGWHISTVGHVLLLREAWYRWDVCCHNASTLLITESKKGKGSGSSWRDVAGQWFKVFENWIWSFASSL